MAMGMPVVSTSVSGIVELVDHMENGLLGPEKDLEALTAAMETLLDDPGLRESLGANGRQKVMAGFSLDQNTAKLRCLFAPAKPDRRLRRAKNSQGKTLPT